jgi:hypothetical protein
VKKDQAIRADRLMHKNEHIREMSEKQHLFSKGLVWLQYLRVDYRQARPPSWCIRVS